MSASVTLSYADSSRSGLQQKQKASSRVRIIEGAAEFKLALTFSLGRKLIDRVHLRIDVWHHAMLLSKKYELIRTVYGGGLGERAEYSRRRKNKKENFLKFVILI